jgi:small subunit ribosomal protein S7
MRGKPAKKRIVKPDEKYNNIVVAKLINYVMKDGKKDTSRTIVYKAIEELQAKTKQNGVEVLEKAIENVKPKIEVRSRRVGGANFQVPVPVSEDRQVALAFRWLIKAARSTRKNTRFEEVLARELLGAYNNEGAAIKKKEEVQRMAEANRAFAQFAAVQ